MYILKNRVTPKELIGICSQQAIIEDKIES